ncbi:hypothetical protein EFA59_04270 [Weissella hellenica]|nr:hypothetical protein EFA59_04270 [Weissella hellenica]
MLAIDQLKTINRVPHDTTNYIYVAFDGTFSTIKVFAETQADLHKQILAMQAQKEEIFWLGRLSKKAWSEIIVGLRVGNRLQDLIVIETARGRR